MEDNSEDKLSNEDVTPKGKVFFALNNPDSIDDIFLNTEGRSLLNSMTFIHYKLNSSVQLIKKISDLYKEIHTQTVSIKDSSDLENFKSKSLNLEENLIIIIEVFHKKNLQSVIDFIEGDSINNKVWITSPINLINQKHLNFFNLFFFFDMGKNEFQKLKNFTDVKESHLETFTSSREDENKVLLFLNERKNMTTFLLENNPCLLDF